MTRRPCFNESELSGFSQSQMRSVACGRLEFLMREIEVKFRKAAKSRSKGKRVCAKGLVRACVQLQPHLTLCCTMDHSPPGSVVQGILQARTLEWVVKPSSRGPSWPRDLTCISCGSCIAGGFLTRLVARQAPVLKVSVASEGLCNQHTLFLLIAPNPSFLHTRSLLGFSLSSTVSDSLSLWKAIDGKRNQKKNRETSTQREFHLLTLAISFSYCVSKVDLMALETLIF